MKIKYSTNSKASIIRPFSTFKCPECDKLPKLEYSNNGRKARLVPPCNCEICSSFIKQQHSRYVKHTLINKTIAVWNDHVLNATWSKTAMTRLAKGLNEILPLIIVDE